MTVARRLSTAVLLATLPAGLALAQTAPPKSPLSPAVDSGTVPGVQQRSPKITNRAAPVEPPAPGQEAPMIGGEKPPLPMGTLIPPSSSDSRPQAPVFANPAIQSITQGKPPPATEDRPAARSEGPDWRTTHAPLDAAFGAYQRGLYVTALKEALDAASKDSSNAAAMTLIGEIYRDGLTGKQDWLEAARWYRLADERGDPQAAFALARAHLEGAGVPQDSKRAQYYFERAAAKGHGSALYNLGIMAIEGEIQDFKKAADLFKRAIEQGDLEATYSLAFFYRSGNGVEKDEAKATALLKQAADQHHLAAMIDYAIALFNGRGTEANEEGAAAYLIRAAWRNAPVAQNRLARMYAAGRGVKLDLVEAMKWHVIARANGLKDEWLDASLPQLTQSQREIVDEAVRKFAVK